MDKFKLALKLSFGYKSKTLGTFIFATLTLTVFLVGVNVLLNTFNGWAAQQMEFLFPNYFVSPNVDFDIQKNDFGFHNLMLDSDTQMEVMDSLEDDYNIYEGIYTLGAMYEKGLQNQNQNVFVVGIDFLKARDLFPTFKRSFTQEEMEVAAASNTLIFEKNFAEKVGFKKDKSYIFLTNNYDRVLNAIKLEAFNILDLKLPENNSAANIPLVFVNLKALYLISGAPDEMVFPLFLRSKKVKNTVGIEASAEDKRISSILSHYNLVSNNPVNIAQTYENTFKLYKLVFMILAFVIIIVVMVSISSNLFILFQQRKSDFGIMKAFGFHNVDLGSILFFENLMGLIIASLMAITIHIGLSKLTGNFYLVNLPSNLNINTFSLQLLSILVIFINIISLLKPIQYVAKLNPIDIFKEN